MCYWLDVFRDRKTRKRAQHKEATKVIYEHIEARDNVAEGTAEGVARYLDKTRLNFAYWMCALSGILVTLGGPTLVNIIHASDKTSSLIPLVWSGILITGLSLVLGIASCALYYYATATNPYYHFLQGLGKGSYFSRCSAQRERLVANMESCHSRSLRLSRWFLLGQGIVFFISVIVVLIGTLAYFKSYW